MVFVQIKDNLYVNPDHVVSIDHYPDVNGDANVSIYVLNKTDPYVVRGVDDVAQWLTRLGMVSDTEPKMDRLPYMDVRDKAGRITLDVTSVNYIYLERNEDA